MSSNDAEADLAEERLSIETVEGFMRDIGRADEYASAILDQVREELGGTSGGSSLCGSKEEEYIPGRISSQEFEAGLEIEEEGEGSALPEATEGGCNRETSQKDELRSGAKIEAGSADMDAGELGTINGFDGKDEVESDQISGAKTGTRLTMLSAPRELEGVGQDLSEGSGLMEPEEQGLVIEWNETGSSEEFD